MSGLQADQGGGSTGAIARPPGRANACCAGDLPQLLLLMDFDRIT